MASSTNKRVLTYCQLLVLSLILIIGTGTADDNDKLIIIDSDGGADDVTAIIQVLKEPAANLLAITCTYGNVDLEQACGNILRTLQLMDMADEVPVYAGCEKPIVGDPFYDDYFGPDGLGNISSTYPLPNVKRNTDHAASAIIYFANMYPGQITLISLGPMTNLALAVQLDPTLPSKLKQLTLMAGSSSANGNASPVAEFNAMDDPIAAQVVISSYPDGCLVTCMTWDMCEEYSPSWEWYHNWTSPNTTEAVFISEIFRIGNFKNFKENVTFGACDLQTTTAVLYPEVVNQTDAEYVQVEICGSLTKGEFVVDYRPHPAQPPNIRFYSTLNMDIMEDLWNDITGYDDDDEDSTDNSTSTTESTSVGSTTATTPSQ